MNDAQIRAKIAALTVDLNNALDEIAEKHGLDKLERGRCTYTDNGFEMKLSAIFAGGDTKDMAKLRSSLDELGLIENACNATIKYGNDYFSLVGMKQRNMVLSKGGKQYTAPITQVIASIKKHNPELVK